MYSPEYFYYLNSSAVDHTPIKAKLRSKFPINVALKIIIFINAEFLLVKGTKVAARDR